MLKGRNVHDMHNFICWLAWLIDHLSLAMQLCRMSHAGRLVIFKADGTLTAAQAAICFNDG